MKTILLFLTLSLTTFLLNAQTESDSSGTTITVTVPVNSTEGSVLFALEDEATFMKKGLQNVDAKIIDGKATAIFKNVQSGTYGIILFHDKNGNKSMDFEPNGMPLESYGVSNYIMSFGPPQWSDAKFEVGNEPIEIEIRM